MEGAVRLEMLGAGGFWIRYLLSFLFPVNALAFALTGPHRWEVALLFVLPQYVMMAIDFKSPPERRAPPADMPRWPFDLLLIAIAGAQLVTIYAMVRMFEHQSFLSMDALAAVLVVGGNGGVSTIVVGHELIHRRNRLLRLLGRCLWVTVLYEHFTTEHIRGHHVRVATGDDPATARFGESYRAFLRRTVPAQFRSAWRLECKRLGDERMAWYDPRQLRNKVFHGLLAELGLCAAILVTTGPAALAVFVLQAADAISLLESTNYIEHWGLSRAGAKLQATESWDSESWFSLYTLVGLTRHADHHAHASRPYHALRHLEESPKMPWGYHAAVALVFYNNRLLIQRMTEELERKKLGPFRPHAA